LESHAEIAAKQAFAFSSPERRRKRRRMGGRDANAAGAEEKIWK